MDDPAGTQLSLLVLKTHDPGRLAAFYSHLGIHFVTEQHGGGPHHFAGRAGRVLLEIYPLPDGAGPPDTSTRLGFKVAELDRLLSTLPANGERVQPQESPWGRRAVLRDPDGRAVELYEGAATSG